jgi:hypothetical protein
MERLTYSAVATVRADMLAQQGGRCALCLQRIKLGADVLDHDHATGAVRGVLHRGCNSLLGKIENNHKRYGIEDLSSFLMGTPSYLLRHRENRTGLLHPTHKTPEEKRLRANAKARATRAARKAGS